MTATSERPRTQPDPEPEREVDFSRYLDALVARWWLPVAGLVIGAAIGYFVALGGKDVYRAQATVYVGTPYGASGQLIQTPATNPNTVGQLARGQGTLQQVAQASGMSVRELRAGVSTRPIKSGAPKGGAEPALRSHGRRAEARPGERGGRMRSPPRSSPSRAATRS